MADDLQAEGTPGFKVGEKKTMEEYQKLGRFDTWKQQILLDVKRKERHLFDLLCNKHVVIFWIQLAAKIPRLGEHEPRI